MDSIQLSQIWTAAAVLAGFQLTALNWRIKREVAMEEKTQETWLTLADGFAAASFLVLVIGVFAAPLSGSASKEMAAKLLGVAMLLFTASPFVLAGHYNLYCSWGKTKPRRQRTNQEWTIAGVSTIIALGVAWWIFV